MEWDLHGMEWNGMEWNGMEWLEWDLHGMEWDLHGMEWNIASANRFEDLHSMGIYPGHSAGGGCCCGCSKGGRRREVSGRRGRGGRRGGRHPEVGQDPAGAAQKRQAPEALLLLGWIFRLQLFGFPSYFPLTSKKLNFLLGDLQHPRKMVVLGTGWGSVTFLQGLSEDVMNYYDITVAFRRPNVESVRKDILHCERFTRCFALPLRCRPATSSCALVADYLVFLADWHFSGE